MSDLLEKLAAYITALQRGLAATPQPAERPVYERRLAAAAQILAALQALDRSRLRELIDQEEHGAGWGFLVGASGAEADRTLAEFIHAARFSGATSAA